MSSPLQHTDHRPWPLPDRPWAGFMRWNDLLFMHWPLDPELLRPRLPAGFTLDTYDGHAWLGITPFRMSHTRPRFGPPAPWLSAFPELNVRTYVTVNNKPGVYFFSLDAARMIAVQTARRLFRLPYFHARMHVATEPGTDRFHYTSHRIHPDAAPAHFEASYRPAGPVFQSGKSSLEHFLTERYALYTTNPAGRVFRGDIHHVPWPLQPAEARWDVLEMTRQINLELPDQAPLLHFAKRLDVYFWWLTPAD